MPDQLYICQPAISPLSDGNWYSDALDGYPSINCESSTLLRSRYTSLTEDLAAQLRHVSFQACEEDSEFPTLWASDLGSTEHIGTVSLVWQGFSSIQTRSAADILCGLGGRSTGPCWKLAVTSPSSPILEPFLPVRDSQESAHHRRCVEDETLSESSLSIPSIQDGIGPYQDTVRKGASL